MIESIIKHGTKRLPKVLNKDQLLKLLHQVEDPHTAMAIFMSVFFGLRIGEFAYSKRTDNTVLKWEDIDLKYGEITILDAKNPKRYKSGYGKDRIVPVFDEFLHIFKLWKELYPSIYLIPHPENRNKPINKRQVQKKTFSAIQKAGLLEVDYYQSNGKPRYKYHFHTFRHVCAANLLRRGLKIEQVKEFLGHEKLETTMVYLDIVKDDLKEAVTQAFAYPKQRNYYLPQKENVVVVKPDVEALRLENENLKLKMGMVIKNGNML